MGKNIENEQETRMLELEWMQAELKQIVKKWRVAGLQIMDDETNLKLVELKGGIGQLELEIKAFQERVDSAVIAHSWRQRMFAECVAIPIDPNEIPF